MLQMLIIGGGIHGVHLAHCLLQQTQLSHDDIRILDPHDELLYEWRRRTRNCGMKYLRSPSVHHLDIHPFSLRRYGALEENRKDNNFIPPKDRPSVELFDAHCRMVIEDHQLQSLHVKGEALEMQDRVNHIRVVTAEEVINTRYVLLAIGMGEHPFWPDWAIRLKNSGASVEHLLDLDFSLDDFQADGPVAVIGAGISGGHIALSLAESSDTDVLLLSRKDILVRNFDFEPGWIGPRYTEGFHLHSLSQRRQQIVAARAKGSVPEDMKRALDRAELSKQLRFITDHIYDTNHGNGGVVLIGRHGRYHCQKMLLATGFVENRPGNGFIDQSIKEFNLQTADCGYPVIDRSLKWHERIFVTGPLSELQVGPIARNIAGARNAGRRITAAINRKV